VLDYIMRITAEEGFCAVAAWDGDIVRIRPSEQIAPPKEGDQ
jgi:hypothetical protein